MIKEAMAVPALVSPPPYRVELAERDETCSLEWWNRVFVFQGNQGSWRQVTKLQRKIFTKNFMTRAWNGFLTGADMVKMYVREDEALLMERVFEATNRVLALCDCPSLPFSGSCIHILENEVMEKFTLEYFKEEKYLKSVYMHGRIYINRRFLQTSDAPYVLAQILIDGISNISCYKEIDIFRDGKTVGRSGVRDVVDGELNNEVFNFGIKALFAHAIFDELALLDRRFKTGGCGFFQVAQPAAFVIFLLHKKAGRHKAMAVEILRRLFRAYIAGEGEAWQLLGLTEKENDTITRYLSVEEDYWEEGLFLYWPEFRQFVYYWQNFLPALR